MSRGKLIVVSGFSGSGKGTLMNEMMKRHDNYALSVSATTRKPRPGEVDGVSYFFVTDDEFRRMIDNNELIEYAGYVNHFYGTPRKYVEENLNAGKDVFLEIEIQGALKVKKQYPDAVLLFVTPPDAEELRRRLISRGTETMDVINARLERAIHEAEGVEAYDYIVINDVLEDCVETVDKIIKSEHNRTDERISLIQAIRRDLKEFQGK